MNNKKKRAAGAAMTRLRAKATLERERFRILMRLSSDLYWETDAEHRLQELVYGAGRRAAMPREQVLGKKRWEIPSAYPDAALWRAHVETLEAQLPFRDFEFARGHADGETRHYSEQLEFLLASGCEAYQGYLFSPPLPADEITRLLGQAALHAMPAKPKPVSLRAQPR